METIGKYHVVRVIGEGGMGRVYEAIDPMIGRRVAVKTISLNASDADTRARFFREAQAAGRLSHPNLITIYDIGDADGLLFIVMEFLEGMDLSRKLREEQLPYDTKIQIMSDVCAALAFAHGHDVVHRDIKPANIFITSSGGVKILDFGLARGAASDMTQTGRILGTPNYMSPEQIRGDEVDHRADIFSAGVVFYELLTGRKAFEGDTVATTLYKVLETQPQPVHLIDGRLPVMLSDVIERALAKDRAARFQTSRELLEALMLAHDRTTQFERANMETMAMQAPLATTNAPTPFPAAAVPLHRWPRAAIRWVVVAVVVGLVGFMLQARRAPDAPPATVSSPAVSEALQVAAPEATRSGISETPASAAPVAPPAEHREQTKAARTTPLERPATREKSSTPPPSVVTPSSADKASGATPAPASPPPTASGAPPATSISTALPIESPPVAPVTTAPQAPPPTAAAVPSARPDDNPAAAVQALLTRYRAALEARDIGALERIWPGLAGRQENAIKNEFEHSRAIAVGVDNVDIRPTAGGASVRCRRSYAVTTADGQTLRTATTMLMTLTRRDGAWIIDTIRHEAVR